MQMKRVMMIYGTRPEVVKMAPIVLALQAAHDFEPIVAVTAQHRLMLDQVNEVFGIRPLIDLDIHQPGQTLADITTKTVTGLVPTLAAYRPDVVMVQGDTTTTFAAALAAFYTRIPVAHVEAGLRTGDRRNPFPEEVNRRMTTPLADLHFTPTWSSRTNLLNEGVDAATIVVTGNTVIDALFAALRTNPRYSDRALEELDSEANAGRPMLLMTAHRRESWGEPMRHIGRAVARIARRFPHLLIVIPVHSNPIVREALLPPNTGLTNVLVVEPAPYAGFVRLMGRSSVVLTDSGGVQEEAPSLGKPVLVMRETTERPEGVDAGTVRLVSTDEDAIVEAVSTILSDPDAYAEMAKAIHPYGDGQAARRTIDGLRHFFELGPAADDFDPDARSALGSPRYAAVS
jgi:UDP-N-acetylglucosamine 2-epimerase (non-hydrolysing)